MTDSAAVVIAQWDGWLERATDRLFELDQRVVAGGTDELQLDLAAAFVCRKAISHRVEAMRATGSGAGPTAADQTAAGLAATGLVDDHGEAVAADLSSAATLLSAILDRVDAALGAIEAGQASAAANRAAARADIVVVEQLSAELGMKVGRVAELRSRLDAALPDAPDVLAAVAGDLAVARAELRALEIERASLLTRWVQVPDDIARLAEREVEVRAVVATCRDKVLPLPALAVPSVAALGAPEAIESLSAKPWAAARAIMAPFVSRLDRLGAAFDEVAARYQAVLVRRDELRGLLHAFRDKAGGHSMAEDADLERSFKAAEVMLWSAPCDVDRAAGLVDVYVDAVNLAVAGKGVHR